MSNEKTNAEGKIILPKNLQREMIKFFLRTSAPKLAQADKENRQTSPNSTAGVELKSD